MKRLSTLCTVFTTYCESIISNKKLKRTLQVPLRCKHGVRPPSLDVSSWYLSVGRCETGEGMGRVAPDLKFVACFINDCMTDYTLQWECLSLE